MGRRRGPWRRLTPYGESRAELRDFDGFFATVKPTTDEQRRQLDVARQLSASIVQTHYLMSRQLRNPFPRVLLVCVVCWATLVFTCVGALSTVNALSVVYEALGAASVASAVYVILRSASPMRDCSGSPRKASIRSLPFCRPISCAAFDGRSRRVPVGQPRASPIPCQTQPVISADAGIHSRSLSLDTRIRGYDMSAGCKT